MSGPEFVDHPYATAGIGLAIPPTLPKFGIPVGLRKDGQRMYVNIPEWQRLELTNSTAVLLLGAIGNGKTTLAKLIVYWLRSLRTEPGNADSRLHRVWVDDTKPHEWDSIAEAYGCKSWTLGSFSFNPLGSDLTISDMEQILRLILAQVVERPLTTNQLSVLRGALQELMRRQIEPSLRSLTILLNDQEREFSIPLFDGSDEQLQLPKEELAGLRQQMTSLLSQVLNGPYRRIFGDKTDLGLTQALAQQMVYVDYTDIPEEAARLMQMLFWIWKRSANEKRSPLAIDCSVFDEFYTIARYPEFTRALHDYIKRLRTSASLTIMISHGVRDLSVIEDVNARQLALNMTKDIPTWIVSRLSKEDAELARAQFGLSERTYRRLLSLSPHCFMLLMPGCDPVEFRVVLPAGFRSHAFSNQALAARTIGAVR